MSQEKQFPDFLSEDSIAPDDRDVTFTKFRSISLKPNEETAIARPTFSKGADNSGYATLNNVQVKPLGTIFQLTPSENLTCPERPYALMRTHFELDSAVMSTPKDGKSKFEKIVNALNACLNGFSEYDFTLIDLMWKGKYLQGSSHCEIHVNIYSQSADPAVYIIEANRVEGDAKPFFSFYREFKALILNKEDTSKPQQNNFFFQPLPSNKVTAEQFLSGVQPIFNMAQEPFFESRLEAAKMLCDLALHPERSLLQLPECRSGCLSSLEKLVAEDEQFEYVKQHAMCAFSSLVEIPGYSESMCKSKSLACLLAQIENPREPAYESIQSRRECARVMAALAKHDASTVIQTLVREDSPVYQCLARVDGLADPRLRTQACKMRDILMPHLQLHLSGAAPAGGR